MKRILIAYLISSLYIQCYSQTQDLLFSNEVVQLFSNYEKGVWLNHFSGTNSKAESIILILGNDRYQYKGILFNISKNQKSQLEGNFNESDIRLIQIDSFGTLQGYITGKLEFHQVSLQFINSKKDQGEFLNLLKIDRSDFNISKCPENMWYASYVGKWDKNDVLVQLQKEEDQSIYGNLSIPSSKKGFVLKGSCSNSSCNKMDMGIYEFNGAIKNQMTLEIKDTSNTIEVQMTSLKNTIQNITWNKQQWYEIVCTNLRQERGNVYSSFVRIGEKNFDKWMNEKMLDWQNQYVSSTPFDKKENRISRYLDVEWISYDWISGILVTNSSWNDSINSEPFIFDKKQNKILDWDDIFQKEFNYTDFFKQWIESHKHELVNGISLEADEWLQNEAFSMITLRPEGICFTSEYNSKWGRRKIILPIDEIKTYLRKPGTFKNLN